MTPYDSSGLDEPELEQNDNSGLSARAMRPRDLHRLPNTRAIAAALSYKGTYDDH